MSDKRTQESDTLFQFYQQQRKHPPKDYIHAPGLLSSPGFFTVANSQRHLYNPLLGPDWIHLRSRGQTIPPDGACLWKTEQTKKLVFIDKELINEKLSQGAAIVLEGLDILDASINAFAAKLDASLPCVLVNSVAIFSQKENEAYGGHRDSDDVLVIHLAGEKSWKIYAPQQRRYFGNSPLSLEQMGPLIKEVVMRPGDALYVRAGVPHLVQTVGDHSLHIAFDLCDRTPNIEQITHEANTSYIHACEEPYVPVSRVTEKYINLLKSPEFQRDMESAMLQIKTNAIAFRQRLGRSAGIKALSKYIKPRNG